MIHSTCVASDVSFQLAVVTEGNIAMRATESLRSLLFPRRSGRGGGTGRERVDRLEPGKLVQLSDVAWSHAKGGEPRRMQSFRRGFQRGEEALHRRRNDIERRLVHRLRVVNARTDRHPSGNRSERELVAEHQVVRVTVMNR